MASRDRGQVPNLDLGRLGLRPRRSSGRPGWRKLPLGLACLAFWGGGSGSVAPAWGSWIDPDTLPEDRSKSFVGDEREFGLVFSDEFDRYLHHAALSTVRSCKQSAVCCEQAARVPRTWYVTISVHTRYSGVCMYSGTRYVPCTCYWCIRVVFSTIAVLCAAYFTCMCQRPQGERSIYHISEMAFTCLPGTRYQISHRYVLVQVLYRFLKLLACCARGNNSSSSSSSLPCQVIHSDAACSSIPGDVTCCPF